MQNLPSLIVTHLWPPFDWLCSATELESSLAQLDKKHAKTKKKCSQLEFQCTNLGEDVESLDVQVKFQKSNYETLKQQFNAVSEERDELRRANTDLSDQLTLMRDMQVCALASAWLLKKRQGHTLVEHGTAHDAYAVNHPGRVVVACRRSCRRQRTR